MIQVGIGKYAISDQKGEIIVTHSLGTCVAVILNSPICPSTAMAHVVLPTRLIERDEHHMGYYADEIIPFLLNHYEKNLGCSRYDVNVSLYGGAHALLQEDIFKVGQKNVSMIEDILRRRGYRIKEAIVGGNNSRTVSVEVATGKIVLREQPMIL